MSKMILPFPVFAPLSSSSDEESVWSTSSPRLHVTHYEIKFHGYGISWKKISSLKLLIALFKFFGNIPSNCDDFPLTVKSGTNWCNWWSVGSLLSFWFSPFLPLSLLLLSSSAASLPFAPAPPNVKGSHVVFCFPCFAGFCGLGLLPPLDPVEKFYSC